MKNNSPAKWVLIGFVLVLVSCTKDTGTSDGHQIGLRPLSFAQWDTTLAGYRSNVVVVDLWATWCLPCIKRFPKMVEMSHQYADRDVRFVSINFDDPAEADTLPKVEKFLQDMQADFDNYYFKENLIDSFEHMKIIGLPTVVIYGKDGQEARRLTGTNPNAQFTDKDIEAVIEQLLSGG